MSPKNTKKNKNKFYLISDDELLTELMLATGTRNWRHSALGIGGHSGRKAENATKFGNLAKLRTTQKNLRRLKTPKENPVKRIRKQNLHRNSVRTARQPLWSGRLGLTDAQSFRRTLVRLDAIDLRCATTG